MFLISSDKCKMQKEIDESKMAAQRLEGRLHHAEDLLEQKQHTLVLTQGQREELERELGKLLTQVEVLEGREKHKVTFVFLLVILVIFLYSL